MSMRGTDVLLIHSIYFNIRSSFSLPIKISEIIGGNAIIRRSVGWWVVRLSVLPQFYPPSNFEKNVGNALKKLDFHNKLFVV
jgi:hypothetical protein